LVENRHFSYPCIQRFRRQNIAIPFGVETLEWREESLMIDLAVSTEYRRVTAGPSDGQVSCDGISARGKNRRIPRFCRHYTSKNTTVKQENEIVERYRLNHAIVVKLYHCYTQFPRNVRLPHRRIATFFRLIVTFLLL